MTYQVGKMSANMSADSPGHKEVTQNNAILAHFSTRKLQKEYQIFK